MVSAGGRRQAACALLSVCVEALARELTGVTGQGDSLATAAQQWTAAGWQRGNPGHRGPVSKHPPS